jgi:hypothetical protein
MNLECLTPEKWFLNGFLFFDRKNKPARTRARKEKPGTMFIQYPGFCGATCNTVFKSIHRKINYIAVVMQFF